MKIKGLEITGMIVDELTETTEPIKKISIEDIDPRSVVEMDKHLFRLRDDCAQTVRLEDGSYRKLRVSNTLSKLHSIYEGSRFGVVLVFEREGKGPYMIHKGNKVMHIEIPLDKVKDFMASAQGALFLERFSKYYRSAQPPVSGPKLEETYADDPTFGSYA